MKNLIELNPSIDDTTYHKDVRVTQNKLFDTGQLGKPKSADIDKSNISPIYFSHITFDNISIVRLNCQSLTNDTKTEVHTILQPSNNS